VFVFRHQTPHGVLLQGTRLASGDDEAYMSVIVRRSEKADVVMVVVPPVGVDFEAVERALIVFALESTAGNRTRAARLLCLTRSALIYRMHKYNLIGDEVSSEPRVI
jgi:DNA-binding NtrC family response regulator